MDPAVPVIELHDDDLKSQTIITLDDDKNESKIPIVTLEDDCPVKKTTVRNIKNSTESTEIILDDEEARNEPMDLDTEDSSECAYVIIEDDSDIDVSEVITLEDEQSTATRNKNVLSSSSRNSRVASPPDILPLISDCLISANTPQKIKPLTTSNKKTLCPKSVSRIQKLSGEKPMSSVTKKPDSEKPYVCDLCFKAFKDKKILRMHYNTHTGEKPFACTICDKVYSNTLALRKHYKIHTGEKPYVCDVCLTSFDQKSSLSDHKLEKHNYLTVI